LRCRLLQRSNELIAPLLQIMVLAAQFCNFRDSACAVRRRAVLLVAACELVKRLQRSDWQKIAAA
jgi:hypothetical protein